MERTDALTGESTAARLSALTSTPPVQRRARGALAWAASAAVVALSWRAADVRAGSLFTRDTATALARFVAELFPPDLSPTFLRTVLTAAGQTMATASAATLLSIVLGLSLGVLASETLWRRGILVEAERGSGSFVVVAALSRAARALLGFIRAVPDILWALVFVTMVGLGALPGTLALAVAYGGMIGRVYADVFDTVDPQPLEALQSTGAGRLQILLRGIWPQAMPLLTAYTLYSFECCVRAAAVLGLVGAGGIGYEIGVSMRLFEYRQVLTLILAFVGLLVLADTASRYVRTRLHHDGGAAGTGIAAPALSRRPAGSNSWALWIALAAGVWASFYFSGFTYAAFADPAILRHAGRFVAAMIPPALDRAFVSSLAVPFAQTIAIAVLGTLIGVALASAVALPATASLMFPRRDTPERHGPGERALRWSGYWAARLTLNLLRAIPELVWVLMCIVVIGLGPFAGTLAIGLHTGGVLGKLYAETMEEAPRRPIEALYALGARPMQVVLRGIWPQVRPMLRSYTLLRWEANLRVSTILGLVGGGGLGQAIYNNIQLGFYPRVATLIVLVYGLVVATDWLGDRLRGRVVGV